MVGQKCIPLPFVVGVCWNMIRTDIQITYKPLLFSHYIITLITQLIALTDGVSDFQSDL
jgi:hypothetical protein